MGWLVRTTKTDVEPMEEEQEEEEEVALTFADFLEMVIRLRSANQPSVLDIADLQKLYMRSQRSLTRRIETLEEMNSSLSSGVKSISRMLETLNDGDSLKSLVKWCNHCQHSAQNNLQEPRDA